MKLFVSRRLFLVGVVAATIAVLQFGSGTASACSCVVSDPVVAIGNADVVFTGTLVGSAPVGSDNGFHFDWTFDVDGVVKGEVTSPQLVGGEDFGAGCGVDFTGFVGSVTVYARRAGDRLASIGCSPTPSHAELRSALERASIESGFRGIGPPSALAVGPTVDGTSLLVLGADGLPLGGGKLPIEPTGVAHCAGTSKAVVWSSGPAVEQDDGPSISGTANLVSIVDLESMSIVAERTIESEWLSIRDQLVCVDGGEAVILSRGDGTNDGSVTVATSLASGGGMSMTFENVTRGVIHPSGTVGLLPSRPGDPVRTLSAPDDLAAVTDVELGDRIAVVGGAYSPDGERFAALVTTSGERIEHDTGATALVVLDVVDGVMQPVAGEPVPLAESVGSARQVAWLDAERLVVERETDDSKMFDAISLDGRVVSTGDVGWGWGLTVLDGSILRSRAGGLELIGPDLTSTPLVPSPDSFDDGFFTTAPIVAAPELSLSALPGDVPALRPYKEVAPAAAPTGGTPSSEPGGPTVDGPFSNPTPNTPIERSDDPGLQVAGLAFVAFFVVGGYQLLRRLRDLPTDAAR